MYSKYPMQLLLVPNIDTNGIIYYIFTSTSTCILSYPMPCYSKYIIIMYKYTHSLHLNYNQKYK